MLPKGWRCHPLYDALGRTLTTTAADGSQQAMAYDATGARLSASRCGGTTGQSGTTTDSYDALGRVLLEQRLDCALNVQTTVTYSVDANGNQTGETTRYAAGGQTTLGATYDPLDRLATRSDGTRLYSYDASGNPTGQLVRDGSATAVHVTATFDGGNRVARMSDAVGAGESQYWQGSYTYDGLGNRTQVVENGTTTTYQYDGENQLTTVKDGTGLVLASYTYDTHHNRTSQTTGSGTTSYGYDSVAGVELTSRTDPSGKQTTYAYDTSGNLTSATYDPTGADQVTRYAYDATGRLASISQPSGTAITVRYDGDGNQLSKTISTSGGGTTTAVNDVYQLGHVAYETDATGTVLASFSYDSEGVPTSVRVGSDPTTAPVYYYVYTGHGDTLALTDATGLVVASYSYDAWGVVTSDTESFPNGWHNPYLYDGRDGARYDQETGLYWLAVRAYDPTLGRFLSRDPLGRAPLFGWADQPYVYAGNNPLTNVDPSGQRFATASAAQTRAALGLARTAARVQVRRGGTCNTTHCHHEQAKQWAEGFLLPLISNIWGAVVAIYRFGKDLVQLMNDFSGWDLSTLLGLVPDALQVFIDGFGAASQLINLGAKFFHWNVGGVMQFVNGGSALLSALMAAWKAWQAGGKSGWYLTARFAAQGIVLLVKALLSFSPGAISTAWTQVLAMVGQFLSMDLLKVGAQYLLMAINSAFQGEIDRIHTMSGDQFCSAEGGWIHAPGC